MAGGLGVQGPTLLCLGAVLRGWCECEHPCPGGPRLCSSSGSWKWCSLRSLDSLLWTDWAVTARGRASLLLKDKPLTDETAEGSFTLPHRSHYTLCSSLFSLTATKLEVMGPPKPSPWGIGEVGDFQGSSRSSMGYATRTVLIPLPKLAFIFDQRQKLTYRWVLLSPRRVDFLKTELFANIFKE